MLVISAQDLHVLQTSGHGKDVLSVADQRVSVSERGVEFPFAVNPVQSVETRLVEIYEKRSKFYVRRFVIVFQIVEPFPIPVVVFLPFLQVAGYVFLFLHTQAADQEVRFLFDRAVGVDKFLVHVADVDLAEIVSVQDVEQYGTAADEGFRIFRYSFT